VRPAFLSVRFADFQPHHTWTERLESHRSTVLDVRGTTAGGKELSSEKVSVASQGVLFALVSSDGITLQYERLFVSPPSLFGPVLTLLFCLMVCAVGGCNSSEYTRD
jgi:hypothetical protein